MCARSLNSSKENLKNPRQNQSSKENSKKSSTKSQKNRLLPLMSKGIYQARSDLQSVSDIQTSATHSIDAFMYWFPALRLVVI